MLPNGSKKKGKFSMVRDNRKGAGENKRPSFLSFEGRKGAKMSFSKCNSLLSERSVDTKELK